MQQIYTLYVRVYHNIVSLVIHLIATLHTLSSLIQLLSAISIVYSVKVVGKVIVNKCHTVRPVPNKRRDDRFPFNIRPMDENMFSTGTEEAI
jgi:hypothetical protein